MLWFLLGFISGIVTFAFMADVSIYETFLIFSEKVQEASSCIHEIFISRK